MARVTWGASARERGVAVLQHVRERETVPAALRRLKGEGTGGPAPTGWRAKLAATKAKAAGLPAPGPATS